jgi:hypothetical protein
MLLSKSIREKVLVARWGVAIFMVALVVLASYSPDAFAARAKQKIRQDTFMSPSEAVEAFVAAIKAGDEKLLLAVLGPEGKQLISSGDEVADRSSGEFFLRMYEEKNQLNNQSDKRVFLEVGREGWPFPIPIVKTGGKWRFDTREGKEEIINRRIGKNELSAIQACLAYVDAQREYASKDREGDGLVEYAQKFFSEPGRKDGLYWEAGEGEEQSPMGPLVANARSEGYTWKESVHRPTPYHGYFYKILKAQGKNAVGGAHDYVFRGRMLGGFALVAYPAEYGSSGVMTFIVSYRGEVYEKDLGKKTASVAQAMDTFDPDKTWRKVHTKYLEPSAQGGG